MPKIDLASIPELCTTAYPGAHAEPVAGRHRKELDVAAGLTQFGVNLVRLEPGAWSSQRHWHTAEDEFLIMVSGSLALITNAGETTLHPGDCAAFPMNDGDGHHLVNRSGTDATFLVVGGQSTADICTYPDIGMDGRYDADGNWVYSFPD